MKILKQLLQTEVGLYLIVGVLTTVITIIVKIITYTIISSSTLATVIANIAGISFAFVANDTIVFKQEKHGWQKRLFSFVISRLITLGLDVLLAFLLVDAYPGIIGQFTGGNLQTINLVETIFAQVIIIILNYILSKFFVFKNKKEDLN